MKLSYIQERNSSFPILVGISNLKPRLPFVSVSRPMYYQSPFIFFEISRYFIGFNFPFKIRKFVFVGIKLRFI